MTVALNKATLSKLSQRDLKVLIWRQKWLNTARPKQLPPDLTDHGNGLDPDWTEWGLLSGRGFGKLGCVETRVPTPVGWRRLGDLNVGDRVFDETGTPCEILKTFDDTPEIAYRLTFSDGTHIDCCGDHQWVTWTHRDRKEYLRYTNATDFPLNWPTYMQVQPRTGDTVGPRTRTTQEIVDTLRQDTARRDLNHCIPVCGELQYSVRTLPLDPWLLGYWLGNGTAKGALFSCHHDDAALVRRKVEMRGFATTDRTLAREFYVLELIPELRRVGVLDNKHVPTVYKEASPVQRRVILAGLLDSDGHCDKTSGHIEFCSMDRRLAEDVVELARSLGQKPVLATGRATLNGVDYGEKYRVTWRSTYNPFVLPRKAAAWRKPEKQALRNRHRMIVSAERIPSKPMRCLTVDSPNHMFLWGEGMIPTHNTLTGANWLVHAALTDPDHLPSAVIAPTLNDVRYTCFEGPTGILSLVPPDIVKDYNKTNLIITLDNDAVIRGFSAEEPERLRGPQFARVWGDELAAWVSDQDTWDMMMFGLRLGTNPRVVWTTTPKPKEMIRGLIEKKTHRHITTGSSYENRANLAGTFFDQLKTYEGTQLGRQEIEGELIDAEEGGVIQRSWLRLWPHDRPLPAFEYVIMSLDTAFTEKTVDRKTHNADPTACQVWGVFWHTDPATLQATTNVMLLDAWQDHLGLPELTRRVKREMQVAYGDDADRPKLRPLVGPARLATSGHKPDIILIEEKGSGISLRQNLEADGIFTYAYNPGGEDKLTRLHVVSDVFARRQVWLPESENPARKGKPKTWCDPVVVQLCSYRGPGSIRHDDHLDAATQAIRLCKNKGLLKAIKPRDERRDPIADAEVAYQPRRPRRNPYGV